MKIVNFTHDYIKKKLSQPSSFDGRAGVAILLVIYFTGLYFANFFVPYQIIWGKLGVPTMTPIFADLRAVLAGFECTRLGYDVLYQMPCDPWNRPLAYPRLWMKFEWLGLNQSYAIVLGVLLAISFYLLTLILIGKLNKYEAVIYILILCSPPTMLLIERANVDILMYDLLFLSLLISSSQNLGIRFIGYATLLIPSFLKLLPIFSLSVILKEKKERAIVYLSFLVTIFIIYYISISNDIEGIKSYFGFTAWYSFGFKILPITIHKVFSFQLLHGIFTNKLYLGVIILIFILFLISIKMTFKLFIELKKWLQSDLLSTNSTEKEQSLLIPYLDTFRVGASLYLGTFITTIALDYKLVFLLFTIPQIIFWIKHDPKLGRSSSFALGGIIATFYLSPFFHPWLLDEMVNWLLWGYFLYTFVLTLPDWLKITIHNLFSPPKKLFN